MKKFSQSVRQTSLWSWISLGMIIWICIPQKYFKYSPFTCISVFQAENSLFSMLIYRYLWGIFSFSMSAIIIKADEKSNKILMELAKRLGANVHSLKDSQYEDFVLGSMLLSEKSNVDVSREEVFKKFKKKWLSGLTNLSWNLFTKSTTI